MIAKDFRVGDLVTVSRGDGFSRPYAVVEATGLDQPYETDVNLVLVKINERVSCGDDHPDNDADCRRDGGADALPEHVERELADEVVTFWEHGKGERAFYVSVPHGLELYAVSIRERRGLWGKLERLLGHGYQVHSVQLAKHVDLAPDGVEVHPLESLPKVVGFVPVPPDAEQEEG